MKPLKRILRPINVKHGDFGNLHLMDNRYCSARFQLVHSYHILENDFKKLCEYIELNENNKHTFSHRIYELILRASTEFESNCTGILDDNGYTKNDNLNIKDYFKINLPSKLNEYEVRINVWTPDVRIIIPFEEWNSPIYASLKWYKSYNSVKHNRSGNFHLATLDTLVNCLAGLYVILASQFGHHVLSPYQSTDMHSESDDGFLSVSTSIFSLKFPTSWTDSDVIKFDWETLKNNPQPFGTYTF